MTTVNLVQDFINPFYDYYYPYSFSYSSNILNEDESYDIEVFDVASSTFTITYRDESTYDYVYANYISNGWYNIQPISDDIWDNFINGIIPGAVRSDFYYYSDMYTLTIIQYNHITSSSATWDYNNNWSTNPEDITRSSFKLLITNISR